MRKNKKESSDLSDRISAIVKKLKE